MAQPMQEIIDEFIEIARELDAIEAETKFATVADPLSILGRTAEQVGKAWCGSYLGYHSRVYYEELNIPPGGANFSPEWGLHMNFARETTGTWVEYGFDDVRNAIFAAAGNPNLEPVKQLATKAHALVEAKKVEVNSLMTSMREIEPPDAFLTKKEVEIEATKIHYAEDYLSSRLPKGQFTTRDSLAASQGFLTPPHLSVEAEVIGYQFAFQACIDLSNLIKQVTNHLLRRHRLKGTTRMTTKRVFIGHGRSADWKDLRDFLRDRLKLEWDEFNRVPIAGITNIARLSEMLDDAGIAFLVLTAEDELADGKVQARMNVIHEAGLFQGRLGFTKAILLLEEGCEEFSNIQGLGQIRFPKGKIKEAFEDIRQVLEREGFV